MITTKVCFLMVTTTVCFLMVITTESPSGMIPTLTQTTFPVGEASDTVTSGSGSYFRRNPTRKSYFRCHVEDDTAQKHYELRVLLVLQVLLLLLVLLVVLVLLGVLSLVMCNTVLMTRMRHCSQSKCLATWCPTDVHKQKHTYPVHMLFKCETVLTVFSIRISKI
jgi:hypothetical protein